MALTQPPLRHNSRTRLVPRGSSPPVLTFGLPRRPVADAYVTLVKASWPLLVLSVVLLYLALNLGFAMLYVLAGDSVVNAEHGNFADYFFFSVQTLATLGYGVMSPKTPVAHWLVTLESLVGMLTTAIVTGLMFAKFSKPSARVEFSSVAVVAPRNGYPTLMFRMSNQRPNQIVEANVKAVIARSERTLEGEKIWRFYDLRLERQQNILFALSWTAMHTIDKSSPLYGDDSESLANSDAELIVSLMGVDETISQPVHARWSYFPNEIKWNCRFSDIIREDAEGAPTVDFRHFHDFEPLPLDAVTTEEGSRHAPPRAQEGP